MLNDPIMAGEYQTTASDLLELLLRPGWQADASCREHPELVWFAESGRTVRETKAICASCLVRAECESYAMADPSLTGIWGGLTAAERRRQHRAMTDNEPVAS